MSGRGHKNVKSPRKVLRNNIEGVTKPAITRLANQAGVPRLSGLVHEDVRDVVRVEVEKLIKAAVAYMEHAKRKTLSSEDFLNAYENVNGKKFYGSAPEKGCDVYHRAEKAKGEKKRKTSPKKIAVQKIKHYQKQTDCFMIRLLPFNRFVREVGQDYKDELRYSENFLNMMHGAVERHIVEVLSDAFHVTVHCKRTTLYAKDVQLARKLRGERA